MWYGFGLVVLDLDGMIGVGFGSLLARSQRKQFRNKKK